MHTSDATKHATEYSFVAGSWILTYAYDINNSTKSPTCIINIQLHRNILIFKYYILNARIVYASHCDKATITDGTVIATDLILKTRVQETHAYTQVFRKPHIEQALYKV